MLHAQTHLIVCGVYAAAAASLHAGVGCTHTSPVPFTHSIIQYRVFSPALPLVCLLPGAAATKPSVAAGAAAAASASTATSVSGMDTPCHRAGIRAYRACLQQGEESLRSVLQDVRLLMLSWAKDEALWKKTWAGILGQVEGL